ncbi:MAG: transporter [Deltaproteobacteria bacterium]|nr:transporter [Deltaproteobacteria bacterium]
MTVLCRPSMFRSATAILIVAFLGVAAQSRLAWAQACCASAGLIAPTRLRSYEDFAVGAAGRVRSVFGAFDINGRYDGMRAGESEWSLEQDLFGAARVFQRGQVAIVLPFIETRRHLSGSASTGGGVGDVAVHGRYDFMHAGEHRLVPGVAVLFGLVAPTGTPPEETTDLWAAGATGQGSWQGSLGIGLEQGFEPYFITLNALGTLRSSRTIVGVGESSFAPRLTGILAVGRVLPRTATVGVFISGMSQGDNSGDQGRIAGSGSSLLTAGLAATISPTDQWRLQGTLSTNVPVAGWGRSQTAGAGVSLSIIRLWP